MAMARAFASYPFMTDVEGALDQMTENEMETMILHEVDEAKAGELLGVQWQAMVMAAARTKAEQYVRAVRDLLADCLSTLPTLIERENLPALHFYFATFDAQRRELFPEALRAYAYFLKHGELKQLHQAADEGKAYWLAAARSLLAQHATESAASGSAVAPLHGDK